MTDFEFTVPVVVVGGGASGCVAALAAHDGGAEVLVLEQDDQPSGSTGLSQGLICAAGTHWQRELGIEDDAEVFFADIMAKTRGQTDPVIARAIADGAGPTLEWLAQAHKVPFSLDTGFRPAYGATRVRVHGWRGHGGLDLIQLLHQRMAEANIDVLMRAKLVEIIADGADRVRGVIVERPDGTHETVGCEALVLASGGFAANADMVRRHMPEAALARHNGHEGNRGDGIRLAAALGAELADMGSYQGYGMLTDPQGISVPPGVLIEGGLMVNIEGKRFTDELVDIAGMIHPVMAQPDGTAWVVFDEAIEDRCAYIPETMALRELNAAHKADTVADLAMRMKVDIASLQATLDDAHRAFKDHGPDCTGREWAADRPPSAPYRALKVCGAIYHTQGGLQIDGDGRVMRADGSVFANLFASGGAARSVSGPSYWGYLPAMGLCTAVALGRLAGQAAARLVGDASGLSAA